MPDLECKARDIFLQALDRQPDQMAAFLDIVCSDDHLLRQRVQALLGAHQKAGNFLTPSRLDETVVGESEDPESERPSTSAGANPHSGTTIGPYKLLEQIGEGGMGSVWMAKQSAPIKRNVAIKLIKPGMDSRQVLARFEAERQALAIMDHPNIARVLDAGMTAQGRPYFAMEYVRGVPMTAYCDQAKLSVKQRLELFLPVCSAVQHAHQKGIIHRDLKPSNILICLYDGNPVPKVIDFGLAKAVHQSLSEHSLYTSHGMIVGTPLYMSPEQAGHNSLDIDTRTDIYALGVILYELLTGSTPLEKAQMKQAAHNEVLRLINEVDPPKPSTRLSGSKSLPSVAALRSVDPLHLTRSVAGDLDWVVMKALEKERSRRYETASGLAEDIRRHMSDEPVSASPPSARYRTRKFIKRNRTGVIAASAIAVVLLLGVGGTTSGMLWALSEKHDAEVARQAESQAKQAAVANAEKAKAEAFRATKAEKRTADTLMEVEAERDAKELALRDAEDISRFLGEVFQSPDPTRDGREIKVAELLDKAAQKLETDLASQPAQRAKLQDTLGRTYHSLGLIREAIGLGEKVRDYFLATRGLNHPDTLTTMNNLAASYHAAGRCDDALRLREEILPLRRKVNGLEHPDTLTAMHNLATSLHATGRRDEAIQLREEVLTLRRRVSGPDHPDTLTAMHNLAISCFAVGRHDEAIRINQEVLSLRLKAVGPEHPDILSTMNNLAVSYYATGRRDEALQLREEVLTLRSRVLGPEHPDTLRAMIHLANSSHTAGRHDEALQLRQEALTLCRKVLGSKHADTLRAMQSLAVSYDAASRSEEAFQLWQEAFSNVRRVFGSEHPGTRTTMRRLAISCEATGRRDEALQLREELFTTCRQVLGLEHPDTLRAMTSLSKSYYATNRSKKAVALWKSAVERAPNNPLLLNQAAWWLVASPDEDGRYIHAAQALDWAHQANELTPNNAALLNTKGVALYRADRWSEAIESLNSSIKHGLGRPHNWLFLAMAHHQLKKNTDAAKWYERALEWQRDNEPVLQKDTELRSSFDEAARLMAPPDSKATFEQNRRDTSPTAESALTDHAYDTTVKAAARSSAETQTESQQTAKPILNDPTEDQPSLSVPQTPTTTSATSTGE